MAFAVASVPVLPTPSELSRRQRRQAWWLLVSRLSSGRTQTDAANALGLSAGSSYGDFERGVTAPSLRQLAILAALFEVPMSLLADPPMTDEERLERDTGRPSRRTRITVDSDDGLAEAQ